MKNIIFVLLTGLFISCGGNEQEQEVIDVHDLLGDTGEISADPDSIEIVDPNLLNGNLGAFIYSQKSKFDTTIHQDFHWMDRFSYTNFKKIQFFASNADSLGIENTTNTANLFYYSFSDTTTTKSAFYNWLDCFGEDCEPIPLNKDLDEIKSEPMYTAIYDTSIVIIEYQCKSDKNYWSSFQDSLHDKFGKNFIYAIDVKCGGPLKWK